MKLLITCVSAALLTAGCAQIGGENATARPVEATSGDAMPIDAVGYVANAGSSDLYEIESSRLALQRTRSPAIRQFAQMMLDHHTMTTQQVMQAARSAGLAPVPPILLPPQRAMLDKLQPVTAGDFDGAYLAQQQVAHRKALGLHRNYEQRGDMAPLRETAAAAVPIVQRHIDQLQTLSPH